MTESSLSPNFASEFMDNNYDYKGRFLSYWHQVSEVLSRLSGPDNILEIGPGNYFLSSYLRQRNFSITTADLEPNDSSEIKIDLRDRIPLSDNSYHAVLCFEVLEHIPFEKFSSALAELSRVSRKYVIFSVPDVRYYFEAEIKILSNRWALHFLLSFPRLLKRQIPPQIPGGHYWEIGREGFSLARVLSQIPPCLSLKHHYRVPGNAVHHMFVLEKN